MIEDAKKILEGRFLLLLDELRGNGLDLTTYSPIILAMLTYRYAEIKSKQLDLRFDVTSTPLDEAINVLMALWPYDQNLLSKYLERTDEDLLKLEHEFPKEFITTLRALNSISFENCTDQLETIFGDLFEFLLFQLAEIGGKTGAGAYTPRTIISLMTEVMRPQSGEDVYDPTCGSGGFLLSAWNYVQKADAGNLLDLYGQDVSLSTSCIARLNMLIHGITSADVFNGSALALGNVQQFKKFDVVMANPPFSVKSWRWGRDNESAASEVYKFGIPPKANADYAFIQHVIFNMNKTGRAAMIVASGVLFRGGVERTIRTKLVEEGYIETVIALPANIFYGTTISAYIVLLRSGRTKKDIFFIDCTRDYQTIGRRNVFDASAIQEIVNTCDSRTSEISKSRLVSFEEIEANTFNLEVSRYVQEEEKEDASNLLELVEKQRKLESKLQVLQNRMHQYI